MPVVLTQDQLAKCLNVTPQYRQAEVTLKTQLSSVATTFCAISPLHRADCRFYAAVPQACLMELDRAMLQSLGILARMAR